jgi:hypothetical protein
MQENLVVVRLGPDLKIEPGIIFQLFLGSVTASHIGLNGGTVFAAKIETLNTESKRHAYVEVPSGARYLIFPEYSKKKRGHCYEDPVWMEELDGGVMPILLIREKPRSVGVRRSHDRMKKGGNRRIQL